MNLTPLQNSPYVAMSLQTGPHGQAIHRYLLPATQNSQLSKAAAQIQALLDANPSLVKVVVSTTTSPDILTLLKHCKYLTISGKSLCLSDRPWESEHMSTRCVDVFFSCALIKEPVKCSRGHVFEKISIQQWAQKSGNQCPYSKVGNHPIITGLETSNLEFQEEEALKSELQALQEKSLVLASRAPTLDLSIKEKYDDAFVVVLEPQVQLAFNLIVSKKSGDHLACLTQEQKLQVFQKLVTEMPVDKLSKIVDGLVEADIDEVISPGQLSQMDLILEKYSHIAAIAVPPPEFFSPTEESSLEQIRTMLSFFSQSPQYAWQAQERLTMLGGVSGALIALCCLNPYLGIASAALGLGAYKLTKRLPLTGLPPCTNLSKNAKNFSPLRGRDAIIQKIISCWKATTPNLRSHPILVGDAGVGKTVITQELARRLALEPDSTIPEILQSKTVFVCRAADLLPSNPFQGKDTLQGFMSRIKEVRGNAIIAIDEVHAFFNEEHKNSLGEQIKSMFDTSTDGFPYTLCATTTEEFEKYIKPDNALARRFTVIPVEELEMAETLIVLARFLQTTAPSVMYTPQVLQHVYNRGEELRKSTSRKQPELSLQILAESINKLKENIGVPQSSCLLNNKKSDKVLLSSFLSPSPLISEQERQILTLIKQLDREIETLKIKVSQEQEILDKYGSMAFRTLEYLEEILKLAKNPKTLSTIEKKRFKFLAGIALPVTLYVRSKAESSFQIRSTLDEAVVGGCLLTP